MTAEDRVILSAQADETNIGLSISFDNLCCYRSRWINYAVLGLGDDGILRELQEDRRDCAEFDRHRRGFKPNEHKDLLLKRWDSKRQFFLTVLGSAVGSLLGLLVGWLTWRLGIK